jgi:hypothetical protein
VTNQDAAELPVCFQKRLYRDKECRLNAQFPSVPIAKDRASAVERMSKWRRYDLKLEFKSPPGFMPGG